jgi:hypothetical protein
MVKKLGAVAPAVGVEGTSQSPRDASKRDRFRFSSPPEGGAPSIIYQGDAPCLTGCLIISIQSISRSISISRLLSWSRSSSTKCLVGREGNQLTSLYLSISLSICSHLFTCEHLCFHLHCRYSIVLHRAKRRVAKAEELADRFIAGVKRGELPPVQQ